MKRAKESLKKFLVLAAATASLTAAQTAVAQDATPAADKRSSSTAVKRKVDSAGLVVAAGLFVSGHESGHAVLKSEMQTDLQLRSELEEKRVLSGNEAAKFRQDISVRTANFTKKHEAINATYDNLNRLPGQIEQLKMKRAKKLAASKSRSEDAKIASEFNETIRMLEKKLDEEKLYKIQLDNVLARDLEHDGKLITARFKMKEATKEFGKLDSDLAAVKGRMGARAVDIKAIEGVRSTEAVIVGLLASKVLWDYRTEVKEELRDLGKSIHTGYDKVVAEFSSSSEAKRSTASAQGVK